MKSILAVVSVCAIASFILIFGAKLLFGIPFPTFGKPDTPPTLAQTIISKLEESPKDWTYTEIEDTVNYQHIITIMGTSAQPSRYAIVENKKCGIKIEDHGGGFTGMKLVTPDTFYFSDNERDAINQAYLKAIIRPIEEAEKRVNDSIEKLKENNIIQKLCK